MWTWCSFAHSCFVSQESSWEATSDVVSSGLEISTYAQYSAQWWKLLLLAFWGKKNIQRVKTESSNYLDYENIIRCVKIYCKQICNALLCVLYRSVWVPCDRERSSEFCCGELWNSGPAGSTAVGTGEHCCLWRRPIQGVCENTIIGRGDSGRGGGGGRSNIMVNAVLLNVLHFPVT